MFIKVEKVNIIVKYSSKRIIKENNKSVLKNYIFNGIKSKERNYYVKL